MRFLSFATFGLAFVARPFGGALFGHLGDPLGRPWTLIAALVGIRVATTLIGLLPSYATIGVAAPILPVVLRFLQGIAVGGQQGAVILLATENAPASRLGFYGSLASAGAPGGVLLANGAFLLITTTLSNEAFLSWGWRLPFLASFVLIASSSRSSCGWRRPRTSERPAAPSVGAHRSPRRSAGICVRSCSRPGAIWAST